MDCVANVPTHKYDPEAAEIPLEHSTRNHARGEYIRLRFL